MFFNFAFWSNDIMNSVFWEKKFPKILHENICHWAIWNTDNLKRVINMKEPFETVDIWINMKGMKIFFPILKPASEWFILFIRFYFKQELENTLSLFYTVDTWHRSSRASLYIIYKAVEIIIGGVFNTCLLYTSRCV